MTDGASFAHASEAELARILDYYQVRWEYEPRRFPILWNQDGAVVESFSPDFYLPDLELYLELTTLKQTLVRKKNRKLRRLRELYPEIRIKLLYGKDFRALLLKYGRIDVAASLIGPEGQAPPAARRTPPVIEPDAVVDPDGPVTDVAAGRTAAAAPIPVDARVAEERSGVVADGGLSRGRGSRRRRARRRAASLPARLP